MFGLLFVCSFPNIHYFQSIGPVHQCTVLQEGWISFECQRRASGYKKQQVLDIMVLNTAQLHSSIYSMLMLWINTARPPKVIGHAVQSFIPGISIKGNSPSFVSFDWFTFHFGQSLTNYHSEFGEYQPVTAQRTGMVLSVPSEEKTDGLACWASCQWLHSGEVFELFLFFKIY